MRMIIHAAFAKMNSSDVPPGPTFYECRRLPKPTVARREPFSRATFALVFSERQQSTTLRDRIFIVCEESKKLITPEQPAYFFFGV